MGETGRGEAGRKPGPQGLDREVRLLEQPRISVVGPSAEEHGLRGPRAAELS